jgi:hypothetical protein
MSAVHDDDASQLRAARSDAQAFAAFYTRWAGPLHGWLRTQVPADVATDLTAEAFAQALLGLSRFRGSEPGSGVAWLWASRVTSSASIIGARASSARRGSGSGLPSTATTSRTGMTLTRAPRPRCSRASSPPS